MSNVKIWLDPFSNVSYSVWPSPFANVIAELQGTKLHIIPSASLWEDPLVKYTEIIGIAEQDFAADVERLVEQIKAQTPELIDQVKHEMDNPTKIEHPPSEKVELEFIELKKRGQ